MSKRFLQYAAFVAAMILSLGVTSCSKEDTNTPLPEVKSAVVDTRAYDKWVYFSFEKGVIGTYTEGEFDYKNNTTWDIAFHKWDVRTNGGAFTTTYNTLDVAAWSLNLGTINFTKDSKVKTYMSAPNMEAEGGGDQRVEVQANTELAKWLTVIMNPIPPKYVMLESAYVVKAANGKLAAIKFTNYMNDKAVKGYVQFNYVYPIN